MNAHSPQTTVKPSIEFETKNNAGRVKLTYDVNRIALKLSLNLTYF